VLFIWQELGRSGKLLHSLALPLPDSARLAVGVCLCCFADLSAPCLFSMHMPRAGQPTDDRPTAYQRAIFSCMILFFRLSTPLHWPTSTVSPRSSFSSSTDPPSVHASISLLHAEVELDLMQLSEIPACVYSLYL